MQKKTSSWITISEESTPKKGLMDRVRGFLKRFKKSPAPLPVGSQEKVQNKIFWGASFVVLLLFTAALIAPSQFVALLKSDLFGGGGGFQLLPEYPSPDGLALQAQQQNEFDNAQNPSTPSTQDSTVVHANTNAVTVQVDALSTDSPSSSSTPSLLSSSSSGSSSASTSSVPLSDKDANRKLLEDLSKQLADLKAQGSENDQAVAFLKQLVEAEMQSGGLHGSAPAVQADTSAAPIDLAQSSSIVPVSNAASATSQAPTLPVETTGASTAAAATNVNIGQNPIDVGLGQQNTMMVGQGQTITYRLNTHRAQVDPYYVLQQNMAAYGSQGVYAAQGTYPQGYVQQGQIQNGVYGQYYAQLQGQSGAYASQNAYAQGQSAAIYNAQLAGAQGTPNSGPKESILVALALTFFFLVVKKGLRLRSSRS